MKKFLFITFMALSSSVFANAITTFNFDDVDSVISNGKAFLVEDLRDGFGAVKGVQVSDQSITVSNEARALILLRNSASNKSFRSLSTMAKSGGDAGGG